ncbi:hypothetical protein MJO28_010361 [Puccinia striiformis f. sp. tritici]|uniref:Uncharacterized protein n=1 Tax=Puccinia striiformis f. sp. tritici TaxID=168172 RepID=A0ACC0E4U4_9BASI|nr:hypothetical protein MJO28_010361 [Puccinia striiformis f. sp. tritici]
MKCNILQFSKILNRPATTTTSRRWLSIKNSSHKHGTSKLESLMNLGPILYDPIRIPHHPIVLCHGLYGKAENLSMIDSVLPFKDRIHYWGRLLEVLRSKILDVKVIIGKNKAASSSYSGKIPHGLPFMEWCRANIGVGLSTSPENDKRTKTIPFSLKEPLLKHNTSEQLGYLPNNFLKVLLLNILDSPAYSNLSTNYVINHFNPTTLNHSNVKYFSIAAKIASTCSNKKSSSRGLSMVHPLWLPSLIMNRSLGGPDGLVTVDIAKWGEFLGVLMALIIGKSEEVLPLEIRGSSAFGSDLNIHDSINDDDHDDHGLKLVKSNWIKLSKYIGSCLSLRNY